MPVKIRVGRITAALLWIAVGILVLMDQRDGSGELLLLLKWWPLILVVWGLEYVLFYSLSRKRLFRLRLDMKGMLIALLAAASIFLVTEQNQYLYLWSRVNLDLTAASSEFSEADGTKIELKEENVPITEETEAITVEGINGDLILNTDDSVQDIRIRPVLWVDEVKEEEAHHIAEQTEIKTTEGQDINIRSESPTYGESNNRQPRVNMEVTLPADRHFDINVQTTNGKITVSNVEALRNISVRTGSGGIVLRNLLGDVKARTTNGNMKITSVMGSVSAETSQGTYRVNDISGAVKLYTQVGDITLTDGLGDIDVKTRNGNIKVNEANFGVKAETLNGNIEIHSVSIGADWSVYSAVGVINLYLPTIGNYTLNGTNSYGTINTNLPIERKNRTLIGEFGDGENKVQVDGNGDLNILRNPDAPLPIDNLDNGQQTGDTETNITEDLIHDTGADTNSAPIEDRSTSSGNQTNADSTLPNSDETVEESVQN